jgi:hypothetical protein
MIEVDRAEPELLLPEAQQFPHLTPAGRVPDRKAANGSTTLSDFSNSPRQ